MGAVWSKNCKGGAPRGGAKGLGRTRVAGVVALVGCAGTAGATDPGFYLLGRAGDQSTYSSVFALSSDGTVATGSSGRSGIYPQIGFCWTQATGRVDFGGSAESFHTLSQGISSDGSVLAGSRGPSMFGPYRAFRLTENSIELVDPSLGYVDTRAKEISGDGNWIVGSSGRFDINENATFEQAFRWSSTTGRQDLGFIAGRDSSLSTGANHDGSVVTGYGFDARFGIQVPFRWTQSTGMVRLPGFQGAANGRAEAISPDGRWTVGRINADGSEDGPVIWDNQGSIIDLDPVNLFSQAAAYDVSDDGSVVVGHGGNAPTFVWTSAAGIEPLAYYLTRNGVHIPDGWQLNQCWAVSGDGLTFGGLAIISGGGAQAFVARIPGSGSLISLLLGAAFIKRRRR